MSRALHRNLNRYTDIQPIYSSSYSRPVIFGPQSAFGLARFLLFSPRMLDHIFYIDLLCACGLYLELHFIYNFLTSQPLQAFVQHNV
jgi:hypothetical protein